MKAGLQESFGRHFRKPPEVLASAPACVHLLGNGTGPMVSVTVGPRTWVAVGRRGDRRAFLRTASAGGETALALDRLARAWEWADPVAAAVWSLEQSGRRVGGFELYASVGVPDGAGFCATASLAAATAVALDALFGLRLSGLELARLCHAGELDFIGHAAPMAGAAAIAQARQPGASLVDCVSGALKPLAMGLHEGRILVADTGLRRPASAPESDRLASDCRRLLEAVQVRRPGVRRLDSLTDEDLASLEPAQAERARELLAENERTRHGAEALDLGDLTELGRLLNASQEARQAELKRVSPHLAGLLRLAAITPGVLGSRISREDGAGCFVALVESEEAAAELERRLRTFYYPLTGSAPFVLVLGTGEPAARLEAPGSG